MQINLEDKEYLVKYPWLLLQKGMNVIDIDLRTNYFLNTAISRGCKKIVSIRPYNYNNNNKIVEIIEKMAYSRHGGYVNLFTKHYVRRANQIQPDYKHSGYKEDRYYKCVTVDKIWYNQNRLHFMNIDAMGFEYDIILGAKCTIKRNKPMILVGNDSYDTYKLLTVNLGYDDNKVKRMENAATLYY